MDQSRTISKEIELEFVNNKEKEDYMSLMSNIKNEKRPKRTDVSAIIRNIWAHRTRFSDMVSYWQFLIHGKFARPFRKYCCWCIPCCTRKRNLRLDRLVSNAESRYYNEIDIVNVLNTVRLFKATFTMCYPPY